ncbi:Fis family transcriptional regulator [Planctomycetales bacterium]|nr:Fis family transcriptional regulator [Planctomycetales bacterium]GHT08480.1 Fis family transcriptional regulator [Planctomycetales bacterium]
MDQIIIVDDDEFMRGSLEETLAFGNYRVAGFAQAEDALAALSDGSASLLLTDMRMPGMSGLELLERALKADPQLPVVMMTAFATVETAVEAMKKGAYDYIMKPFDAARIEVVVKKALAHRRLLRENEFLKDELNKRWSVKNFIGKSPVMKTAFEQIRQVAATNATVFIHGESGTGKEMVARAVHAQSPRRHKPLICVNCAALSAGVLESELFGHEKGAFTGADKRRIGRFELADGGTLFLDEVTEMNLELQGKLLRVLQEREFERVGSSETISVDVRILASSNRDMAKAIADGIFRQDLFYRLNVVEVELPPLRARKDDVRALVNYFIEKYNREQGTKVKTVGENTYRLLESYDWPGNVRELTNIVERAIVLGNGGELSESVVAQSIRKGGGQSAVGGEQKANSESWAVSGEQKAQGNEAGEKGGVGGDDGKRNSAHCPPPTAHSFAPQPLENIERDYIYQTLKFFDGHRQKAAQSLAISERSLRDRLKRWQDGESEE